MPVKRFFDTNVLVYAFAADDPRSARAEALIAAGGIIGVQVLNEFASVARRKLNWSWQQVEAALFVINELLGPARALTAKIHRQAIAIARARRLAFYDALIVAAALDARCTEICSEDLQHGQRFGTVTVNNPFRD